MESTAQPQASSCFMRMTEAVEREMEGWKWSKDKSTGHSTFTSPSGECLCCAPQRGGWRTWVPFDAFRARNPDP